MSRGQSIGAWISQRSEWWVVVAAGLGLVELTSTPDARWQTTLFAAWSIAALAACVTATRTAPRHAVLAICAIALCAAAFVREPVGTDVWSYQGQGRLVAEYRENPYVAVPADHPDDPVLARVEFFYTEVRSVYGPAFAIIAAVPAWILGDGTRAVVAAWRLIGVAAFAAMWWMLRRRTSSTVALTALALCPLVVHHGIHIAHNDMIVGVALLGGCLLVQRERYNLAALAFTAGALVKIPAGLAIVTLLVWLLGSNRRRDAWSVSAIAAGTTAVSFLPFGPRATTSAILSVGKEINGLSLWNIARGDWRVFVWQSEPTGVPATPAWVTVLSLGIPLALTLYAAWRLRLRPFHEPLLVALLSVLVLAVRPASWLFIWVVPVAALVTSSRVRNAVIAFTLLFQVMAFAQLLPSSIGGGPAVQHVDAPMLGLTTAVGLVLVWWLAFKADAGGTESADGQRLPFEQPQSRETPR